MMRVEGVRLCARWECENEQLCDCVSQTRGHRAGPLCVHAAWGPRARGQDSGEGWNESAANRTWPRLEQEGTGQNVKPDEVINGWKQGRSQRWLFWRSREPPGALDPFEKDFRGHEHPHSPAGTERSNLSFHADKGMPFRHSQFGARRCMCRICRVLTQCLGIYSRGTRGAHLKHCVPFSSKTISALKTLGALGELALHSLFRRRKVTSSIRWPQTSGRMPYVHFPWWRCNILVT